MTQDFIWSLYYVTCTEYVQRRNQDPEIIKYGEFSETIVVNLSILDVCGSPAMPLT